jgi:SAM-dependent methyltransferase
MTASELVKMLRENPRMLAAHAAKRLGLVPATAEPSPLSNVEYNRSLWDRYSARWTKQTATLDDPSVVADRESNLRTLGDEWGRAADVDKIVEEYIYPYIDQNSVVAEIGVGGGRIAAKVADRCGALQCFDISPNMMERAKTHLAGRHNVNFTLLQKPELPSEATGTLDFVYSFDVFVHLDVHTMWRYFREFERVLKKNGHAFVHTANLRAPGGWERFSKQERFAVEGHYFITPDTVEVLAERAGLKIVKNSNVDSANYYFNRDYLAVLQKP